MTKNEAFFKSGMVRGVVTQIDHRNITASMFTHIFIDLPAINKRAGYVFDELHEALNPVVVDWGRTADGFKEQ